LVRLVIEPRVQTIRIDSGEESDARQTIDIAARRSAPR